METFISILTIIISVISLWLSIKNIKTQSQMLLSTLIIEQYKNVFDVKRCLIRDTLFLEKWIEEDNKLILTHKQLCLITKGVFKDPDEDIGNMHGYLGIVSSGSKNRILNINDREVDLQIQASKSADAYMKKLESYYKILC